MTYVFHYGNGYDLVVVEVEKRFHLGIRCHTCNLTSFHYKDISERYCGCCHRFHEDQHVA